MVCTAQNAAAAPVMLTIESDKIVRHGADKFVGVNLNCIRDAGANRPHARIALHSPLLGFRAAGRRSISFPGPDDRVYKTPGRRGSRRGAEEVRIKELGSSSSAPRLLSLAVGFIPTDVWLIEEKHFPKARTIDSVVFICHTNAASGAEGNPPQESLAFGPS